MVINRTSRLVSLERDSGEVADTACTQFANVALRVLLAKPLMNVMSGSSASSIQQLVMERSHAAWLCPSTWCIGITPSRIA